MSWKMFWQIALLIVVAAVIMCATKFGMMCMKYQVCGKGMMGMKTPGQMAAPQR